MLERARRSVSSTQGSHQKKDPVDASFHSTTRANLTSNALGTTQAMELNGVPHRSTRRVM